MRHGSWFGLGASASITVLASTFAVAQTSPPEETPSADRGAGLEEIVVTARRRAEALQNVPVSVDVVSAAALETRGVHTESDLQVAVPGLTIVAGDTNNELNFVMRGESVDGYSGSPPGVQPYVDEVPVPVMSATQFFDLENVQAVKGPQGTLFGRNSTGGAVLFQTAMPKNDFEGYASVQYGNFDRLIAEAAVNVPIISDKLLVRFSGLAASGGAFVYNLYTRQRVGDDDERDGRITIEARPMDNLVNVTTVQLEKADGTDTPNTPYYTAACGQPSGFNSCIYSPTNQPFFSQLLSGQVYPGYPSGYVYPGGFQSLAAFQRSVGKYVVDQNAPFDHELDSTFAVNKTTLDLSSAVSIKNVFGYSYASNTIGYDTDFSPYPIVQMYAPDAPLTGADLSLENSKTKTISDELQMQGTVFDQRLNYMLGLFYIGSTEDYLSPIWLASYDAELDYHAETTDKSYAAFTQETYKLTDNLNLTLGGRYTKERISQKQLDNSFFGVGNPQFTEEGKPSWTASLDYHFNPSLMGYITTRGSWRRGGFNPFSPPTPTPETAANAAGGNYFLPETVRDAEAGLKFEGRIADTPLRANIAVYNSWITNVQKTAFLVIDGDISSATVNVPKSKVTGVEADFNVRPIDWLVLGASTAYTDARFTDATSTLFGNPVTYGPFGEVPRFSGSIYGDTQWKLPDNKGSLNLHADVYGQSSFYFSNLGGTVLPGTQLPAYTLINMRLDWADMFGKGVKVGMFVKNLANRLYYTGGDAAALDFSVDSAAYGEPRTFGIVIREDF
jgi:iron complex outermembrane receptor protein